METRINEETAPPSGPVCGNAVCERIKGESESSCSADCHALVQPTLPEACVERGIKDPEECKKFMESLRAGTVTQPPPPGTTTFQLPRACTDRGITDPVKCKALVESQRNDGTTEKPVFAKECIEEGITDPEACKKRMAESAVAGRRGEAEARLPELCKLKGIVSPEDCKSLMTGVFKAASRDDHREGPPAGTIHGEGGFGFSSMLPKACLEAKVEDPVACKALMHSQDQDGSAQRLPKECQEKGLKTGDDCRKFFEERSVLPECKKLGAKNLEECRSLLAAQHLPEECREKGIADEKECKALLQGAFMPKTCEEKGVKTFEACQPLLLEKYGRPEDCAGVDDAECWRMIEAGKVDREYQDRFDAAAKQELPEKCESIGATTHEECERAFEERNVPAECRDAGIFSRKGCEKHLFEKYQGKAMRLLPEECQEEGVQDAAACRDLMESRYFPKECVEAKITDPDECKRYLVLKHMPPACRDAGIESKDECEAFLRQKFMTPTCEAQGIVGEDACEEFVYGHVAGEVSCRGLGPEACALAVKRRHLGAILDANKGIADIDEGIKDASDEDGTIDLAALALRGDDSHARMTRMLPVRPSRERKFRALKSEGRIAVGEDDTVDAAAGSLLAYDTDGDGVPDDVESRHGLDPDKTDTDGDGEDDAVELKKKALKGYDKALAGGAVIGQPLVEGETDPKLTVALPEEAAAPDVADPRGVAFEGTGEPGSVVTLYVYSDLPIVVTTTVDENGQWSYEMADGLKDGTHEVYVAINDDTGKVAKKSSPLSLLIRGASAATASDAAVETASAAEVDSQANAARTAAPETDVKVFMLGGGALILAAALVVISLVMRKRKKESDRSDGNMLT